MHQIRLNWHNGETDKNDIIAVAKCCCWKFEPSVYFWKFCVVSRFILLSFLH